MSRLRDRHARWMKDLEYRAYADLEGEFVLASELIRARTDAGTARRSDGNQTGSCSAMGKRQGDAFDAIAGAACERHGDDASHQLHAGLAMARTKRHAGASVR